MPENDFEIIVSVFPFAREIIRLPADDLEAHSVEVLNDLGIDPNVSMNLMELHANLPDLTDKAAVVVGMEKVRPLIKTNIQNQIKKIESSEMFNIKTLLSNRSRPPSLRPQHQSENGNCA